MFVAAFHARFIALLVELGATPEFHGRPNEVPEPVPFAEDHAARPYDPEAVIRHHRNGRTTGGAPFSRGKLYALLADPLYAAGIRHKGEVHPSRHEAIVTEPLWQAVQDLLAANR